MPIDYKKHIATDISLVPFNPPNKPLVLWTIVDEWDYDYEKALEELDSYLKGGTEWT